jgi:hypothetical protein
MVLGIMTGRGTLPLIKVPSTTKVNSEYYVKHVLEPLMRIYLPQLYGNELNKVFIHHDACTSHTSRYTMEYIEKYEEEFGVRFIRKREIPVKSCDASPMDFFGFGYLKQKLKRRRPTTLDGLVKVAKEVWIDLQVDTIKRVYDDWQFRLKLINQRNGEHIENVKIMHK